MGKLIGFLKKLPVAVAMEKPQLVKDQWNLSWESSTQSAAVIVHLMYLARLCSNKKNLMFVRNKISFLGLWKPLVIILTAI